MTHSNNQKNAIKNLSFEFFPPRRIEQQRRFWRTVGCLETLDPTFFSVTYGALGSQSEASFEIVRDLLVESDIATAAHLTCANQTAEQMESILDRLHQLGVSHIVALRGDHVEEPQIGGEPMLKYAEELVKVIAATGKFDISVAAYPEIHPEASSAQADLDNLKRKFDAGATRALTQYFYDTDAYLRFRDTVNAAGITQPIVPGILPVHDIDKVVDFSKRCGAIVPEAVVERFTQLRNKPDDFYQNSIAHTVDMCETLSKEGIEDFHFYTLNQSALSYDVTRVLRGEKESPEIRAA